MDEYILDFKDLRVDNKSPCRSDISAQTTMKRGNEL